MERRVADLLGDRGSGGVVTEREDRQRLRPSETTSRFPSNAIPAVDRHLVAPVIGTIERPPASSRSMR